MLLARAISAIVNVLRPYSGQARNVKFVCAQLSFFYTHTHLYTYCLYYMFIYMCRSTSIINNEYFCL